MLTRALLASAVCPCSAAASACAAGSTHNAVCTGCAAEYTPGMDGAGMLTCTMAGPAPTTCTPGQYRDVSSGLCQPCTSQADIQMAFSDGWWVSLTESRGSRGMCLEVLAHLWQNTLLPPHTHSFALATHRSGSFSTDCSTGADTADATCTACMPDYTGIYGVDEMTLVGCNPPNPMPTTCATGQYLSASECLACFTLADLNTVERYNGGW